MGKITSIVNKKLQKLYKKYNISGNPDSLSIVNFINEYEVSFGINLFDHEITRITDIDYLEYILRENVK